jgi:hypothetical protein
VVRSIVKKVMWVGRVTVFLVGLSVILAVVLGVATMAFAANGNPWILGQGNAATAITSLGGAAGVEGPMLRITNNDAAANDTALDLRVQSGEAPMTVNTSAKVANLNADRLDGKDQSAFADVNELGGQLVFDSSGPLPKETTFTSEGGTLVILASGSGFRGGAEESAGRIGMDVEVDGFLRGVADGFDEGFNELHETFVDEYIVLEGVRAGTHTIRLEARYDDSDCDMDEDDSSEYCTRTNSDDFFAVTVIELSD